MLKRNESGVGLIAVAVALLGLLFVATAVFAGLTYQDRNKYRDKTDSIVAAAVAKGRAAQADSDKKQFAEDSKKPFKTFLGPEAYGSLSFQYPKTWSAYIDTSNSSEPINGYFYPDIVPGTQSGTAYALRLELVNSSYAQILQQFTSKIRQGQVRAVAYLPPKLLHVPGAEVGTMLSGSIGNNITGQMLVIKLRDKTLEISSQSVNFVDDFNQIILPRLSFAP